MKINEVINEIKNPYLRGIVQGITGVDFRPIEQPSIQPTVKTSPAVVTPKTTPKQTDTTTAPGLPPNVKVLASSPLVLQVDKRRFELDNMDQWHPLGSTKTVSPGEAAILNRYLSML